jgi:hypothetical protein
VGFGSLSGVSLIEKGAPQAQFLCSICGARSVLRLPDFAHGLYARVSLFLTDVHVPQLDLLLFALTCFEFCVSALIHVFLTYF